MKQRRVKLFPFILVFILFQLKVHAQMEFLVKVNQVNGSFSKIDSIPGVNWIVTGPSATVFDEHNHRYIFAGSIDQQNNFLYSIDAVSGATLSNPSYPVLLDPADNVVELQFDNDLNALFGLQWDNSESTEYFVSVDPSTGIPTQIQSIPGVVGVNFLPNYTTYDSNSHRYFFRGYSNSDVRLIAIDAISGNIISNPLFPVLDDQADNVVELQYNDANNIMYALHWDNSTTTEYLVTVDPITGNFTTINALPEVYYIDISPHYTTMDEVNNHYIFKGADNNGNWYLYTIDATTGNIIYNPSFPVLEVPSDNVIELKFDNITQTLLGLHWDAHLSVGMEDLFLTEKSIRLFPNPMSDHTSLVLDKFYNDIDLFIYSSTGETVRKILDINNGALTFQREDLSSGVYTVNVMCNHLFMGAVKLVVE